MPAPDTPPASSRSASGPVSVERPGAHRLHIAVHRVLVFGLLAWMGVGIVQEIDRNATRQREGVPRRTLLWRTGMPPVQELEGVLRQVDSLLPPGEPLAFHSGSEFPGNAFFRQRWAAYLLAERDVIPFSEAGRTGARHVLVHGSELPIDSSLLEVSAEALPLPPPYRLFRLDPKGP